MRPRGRPAARPRRSPNVQFESGALDLDVREAIAFGTARSRVLSDVGEAVFQGLAECAFDAPASELRFHATTLRSASLYASVVAGEFSQLAGQLDEVANVREAIGSLNPNDD